MLEQYKNLIVIGAHLGGWSVWDDAEKILPTYDNFYVDCSSSLYALSPEKATEIIKAYDTKKFFLERIILCGIRKKNWNTLCS